MVSSPRKKHHIARSGQQEQQRAKAGQDTTQQVSSRSREGAGRPSPKTSTLCHQALLKGTGESHENRCKESGETDQVVLHNRNMEFKGGTRSKQSVHTRWMDRHRLGRMLRTEADYSFWTDRMVRSCLVIIRVDADRGDGG